MAFDSAISIGGQSLLDGVWRILQPALPSLGNLFPVSVPGMTNGWVRIRKVTPSLVNAPPPRLKLDVEVEAGGDLLLTASVRAGILNLTLPNLTVALPPLPPTSLPHFKLPSTTDDLINITLPQISGRLPLATDDRTLMTPLDRPKLTLAPDLPGKMTLPEASIPISVPGITTTINLQEALGLGKLGLPLPAVIPLAINLTPNPVPFTLSLPLLEPRAIDSASAFGVLLELGPPGVTRAVALLDADRLASTIGIGLVPLLAQLRVPTDPAPANLANAVLPIAHQIIIAVQNAIDEVVEAAFTNLTARTGRLIFPKPADGSPCDVALLPTVALARVFTSTPNPEMRTVSGPVIQVFFARTGVTAPPSPSDYFNFSPVVSGRPDGPINDVEVRIGNGFLLELLCCLVEKLPKFTFSTAATTAVRGEDNCCGWSGVTLNLWPLVLTGTLSLCVVGPPMMRKKIQLRGDFAQETNLGRIGVKFTLELNLYLNDVASVTGLRFASVALNPTVDFSLAGVVAAALAIAATSAAVLLGAGFLASLVPALLVFLVVVPMLLINFVREQLRAAVETLLNAAHALTSPVAVPPAVFEAFGHLVPASVVVDDLTARGVLATPTSPWALAPITATLPQTPWHTDPQGGKRIKPTQV